MKPARLTIVLALATLLGATGCTDMHDQPSFKAQEAPRLSAPATAVPIQGKVPVAFGTPLENPVPPDEASLNRGTLLYHINCSLCHGTRETYLGEVGKRMKPPPPSLHDERVRQLSESDIFQRITFGFGRMPAFGQRLDYRDRWHIVNYVKTF